jgi:SAM-dependent methyltransferase
MNQRDLLSYGENYNRLPFEPVMVEYRRRIVIQSLQKYRHDRILEIGCGNEPLFRYFSDFSEMTTIEPTGSFYLNALNLKNNNSNKNKIDIYNDLFENIADILKKRAFDFIIISCLLHEIPDDGKFLDKTKEICNSGTTIHINVPNAHSFHRLLALEMEIIDSVFQKTSTNIMMQQNRVYDLGTLSDLLMMHKFRIIESGSYFIKPFTHGQMEELIKNRIIDERILDGLFSLTRRLPDLGSEIFVNCSITD